MLETSVLDSNHMMEILDVGCAVIRFESLSCIQIQAAIPFSASRGLVMSLKKVWLSAKCGVATTTDQRLSSCKT